MQKFTKTINQKNQITQSQSENITFDNQSQSQQSQLQSQKRSSTWWWYQIVQDNEKSDAIKYFMYLRLVIRVCCFFVFFWIFFLIVKYKKRRNKHSTKKIKHKQQHRKTCDCQGYTADMKLFLHHFVFLLVFYDITWKIDSVSIFWEILLFHFQGCHIIDPRKFATFCLCLKLWK